MSKIWEHIDVSELGDFVDGEIEPVAAERIMSHLKECSVCESEHRKLTGLLASAKQLPRSVLPEEDLWPDLRRELTKRKEIVLPVSTSAASPATTRAVGASRDRKRPWLLAAAAVVLIAASSYTTAVVLRSAPRSAGTSSDSRPSRAPEVGGAPIVRNASFAQAEARYQRTIDELRVAVETQRGRLSPETIRTVDRSLAVIDSAIAEARAALVADPNNHVLVDLLSASYERKLELLRRTSELSSRI